MSDNNHTLCKLDDLFCHFIKLRGISNHIVINACETRNEIRNCFLGVNKRRKLLHHFLPVMNIYSNLRDLFKAGASTGGFYIENGVQSSWQLAAGKMSGSKYRIKNYFRTQLSVNS